MGIASHASKNVPNGIAFSELSGLLYRRAFPVHGLSSCSATKRLCQAVIIEQQACE